MADEEADFDSMLPTPINATSSSSSSSSEDVDSDGDEKKNNNVTKTKECVNNLEKNIAKNTKNDIRAIRSKHIKRKRYKISPYSRNNLQSVPNEFERSNGINIEINSTINKNSDNENSNDTSLCSGVNKKNYNNDGNATTNNPINNLLNVLSYAKYPANFYTTYMILSQLSSMSTFGGIGAMATTPMMTTLASGLLSSVTTFFTSKIFQKRI